MGQFAVDLQTDDGSELSIFDTSYTQKLEMIGGDLIRRATDASQDGVLRRIVESDMTTPEKVEHLFLSAVARKPSEKEAAAIGKLFVGRDDATSVFEDVWWALLNSSEFMTDR